MWLISYSNGYLMWKFWKRKREKGWFNGKIGKRWENKWKVINWYDRLRYGNDYVSGFEFWLVSDMKLGWLKP